VCTLRQWQVVLDYRFLTAGAALKVFFVTSAAHFATRKVGIGRHKPASPAVAGIWLNTEMGALRVPAKVHIHSEKRKWDSAF